MRHIRLATFGQVGRVTRAVSASESRSRSFTRLRTAASIWGSVYGDQGRADGMSVKSSETVMVSFFGSRVLAG